LQDKILNMRVTSYFNLTKMLSALVILFVVNSCKKDEPDPEPTPMPIAQQPWDQAFTASSAPYFKATINGAQVQKTGTENYGYSFSIGAVSHASFGSGIEDSEANFIAGLDFGRLYLPSGGYPDENDLRTYIRTGAYLYGIPETPNTSTYNALVQYRDASGAYWSTDFGSGAQTSGASCSITDTLHTTFLDGTKGVKFKATFNCTLYNMDGTSSMPLTNGVYVGYLAEY
jgi:hypothetical protein